MRCVRGPSCWDDYGPASPGRRRGSTRAATCRRWRARFRSATGGASPSMPAASATDPVTVTWMGLPAALASRTKGQLATDTCAEAYADGRAFDCACGDEVYGTCTQLREFFEQRGQADVLRVASSFTVGLA